MTDPRKSHHNLLRPARSLVAAALLALALVPSSAAAATYELRPVTTLQQDSGWTVTPSGTTVDAALAAPVTQPATPSTTGANLIASSTAAITAAVGVAAPPLAANESVAGATAWIFASTGNGQPLTISLRTGATTIGTAHVAAGGPSGWLSVTAAGPLSASQVGDLSIALTSSGRNARALATTVYVAYVELTTTGAPATAGGGGVAGGGGGGGGGAAGTTTGAGAGGGGAGGGATTGNPGLVTSFLPSLAAPSIAASSRPIVVSARATSLPIGLSCPAVAVGGCHGMLTLTLSAPHARYGRASARIARCGRGCRTIGRAPFNIARGQRQNVHVHMAVRGNRLFGRSKQITITAKTTVHDVSGSFHSSSAQIIVRRG